MGPQEVSESNTPSMRAVTPVDFIWDPKDFMVATPSVPKSAQARQLESMDAAFHAEFENSLTLSAPAEKPGLIDWSKHYYSHPRDTGYVDRGAVRFQAERVSERNPQLGKFLNENFGDLAGLASIPTGAGWFGNELKPRYEERVTHRDMRLASIMADPAQRKEFMANAPEVKEMLEAASNTRMVQGAGIGALLSLALTTAVTVKPHKFLSGSAVKFSGFLLGIALAPSAGGIIGRDYVAPRQVENYFAATAKRVDDILARM